MKIGKNIYIWMLLLLSYGCSSAQKIADYDKDYEKTLSKLAATENVKLDTVRLNSVDDAFRYGMFGFYNQISGITLRYFINNYPKEQGEATHIARYKKYVMSVYRHEKMHENNVEISDNTLFKDALQVLQWGIQDEISARFSQAIGLRDHMKELYRKHGKLVMTDLKGNKYNKIPDGFKKEIKGKKLYENNFLEEQYFNDMYVYLTYLVNNPSVLASDDISTTEADYMLMAVLDNMDYDFEGYLYQFSNINGLTRAWLVNRLLNLDYEQLVSSKKGIKLLEEMEVLSEEDRNDLEQYKINVDESKKKIKNYIEYDEALMKMYTIDGVDFMSKFSLDARRALATRMSDYVIKINEYWYKSGNTEEVVKTSKDIENEYNKFKSYRNDGERKSKFDLFQNATIKADSKSVNNSAIMRILNESSSHGFSDGKRKKIRRMADFLFLIYDI